MTLEEILRTARDLAPALRARADEAEAARRMPDRTIEALVASGILRICQPRTFGGSELGWDALCEMTFELAAGDGSQAWVANIYGEHGFLAALFPEAAQREIWGRGPDCLISASIVPPGNAVTKVAGGFVLDGRWPFTSGVHHSRWTIVSDKVANLDGAPIHYFLVPAEDRTILDDWQTVGMVATGSSTIVLDKVFVPEHRALGDALVAAGDSPGSRLHAAPLYRMPMIGFAQLALAAVPVGIALGMVADYAAELSGGATLPDLSATRFAESAAEIRAARLLLLEAARSNMAVLARGARLGPSDAAATARDGAYATLLARRTANRIFEAAGARGMFLKGHMQRAFRDVIAATSHGALHWERSALRYAAAALKPFQ